jgi:transaldolase
MANNVQRLARVGQSIWFDNIERRMLGSGALDALIAEGLLGMTSNPTIFEKAVAGSADYDPALRRLAAAGASGGDGFVSIEVSPRLAHDTEATLAEARRLWRTLARPNVMIKIPATREGLPAIEQAIADGIHVNVTLMFSMAHYEAVVDAYLRGLERRATAGEPLGGISSVASFFVSRVDVLLDPKLEALAREGGARGERAAALVGKAAIANSKRVYRRFGELFRGERFARLAARGARRQRVLWASTGTKNPAYPDTLYVDTLIGPDTVNTVPPETWTAILDHARVERSVDTGLDASDRAVADLAALGFDLDVVGEQLSREGVDKFAKSFEGLLGVIAQKRKNLAG